MYQILKVLNNNSVLVQDEKQQSMIFVGKGIGFGKKSGQRIELNDTMEVYQFSKRQDNRDVMEIIGNVDPIYIEAAGKIIHLAKEHFEEVDTNILLPLADHIAFSIERIKADMIISNPFAKEIALLYKEEHEVALQGKQIIKKLSGYEINDDEVGYITLHVHSALGNDQVSESMQTAIIIHDSIEEVEREFNIHISTDSLSYIRLMNHMKFLMLRLQSGEKLQLDVGEFVQREFPFAYQSAQTICEELHKLYQKEIPEEEIGYLALHIERIRTSELNNT